MPAVEICEYRLWCPECGDKSALWSVEEPTHKDIRDSFEKHHEMVTYPTHAEHGTFTFVDERHYPASSEQITRILGAPNG